MILKFLLKTIFVGLFTPVAHRLYIRMDDAFLLPPTVQKWIQNILDKGADDVIWSLRSSDQGMKPWYWGPAHTPCHTCSFCRFETDSHSYGKLRLHLLSTFLLNMQFLKKSLQVPLRLLHSEQLSVTTVNHDVTSPFYSIQQLSKTKLEKWTLEHT